MNDIHKLLDGRAQTYGKSFVIEGKMCRLAVEELKNLLLEFPEAWIPWLEVLHKLCRILATPRHLDSWRDIAGWATLVVDHIEAEMAKAKADGK